VLVTDAISALGLEEGTHQLGQLAIEVKGGRALVAGTETLCGSIANMNQCIQFFKKAVCKSSEHRTCKEVSWESCAQGGRGLKAPEAIGSMEPRIITTEAVMTLICKK
jgi:N-acetylglucosamine-6-phosphate deacetylase